MRHRRYGSTLNASLLRDQLRTEIEIVRRLKMYLRGEVSLDALAKPRHDSVHLDTLPRQDIHAMIVRGMDRIHQLRGKIAAIEDDEVTVP